MTTLPVGERSPAPWLVLTLGVALFGARLLAAHFMYFFQNDELSLAAGVAALVQHNALSDTYRYGPQVGYHRLVQAIVTLLGNPSRIPHVMITLSALSGAVIPCCGLLMFPAVLRMRERWVLFALLAINPILWMSSTYGNSTMPATMLLVVAVTMLSRAPSPMLETLALALFGAGIVVRADTFLASPAIGLLLWQRYGRIAPVARRVVPLGVGMVAVYALLFAIDPRMASSVHDVGDHLTNAYPTRFWEYLLWSMSPVVLLCGVVGLTELSAARRALLAVLVMWVAPFVVFYFSATTTPRYFVPSIVPLVVLASVGAVALPRLLVPSATRLAGVALGLVLAAPLFIGLGWYAPTSWKTRLTQAEFETQVGPMWTGAFLYKSYLRPGFLVRSVNNPGFGRANLTEHAIDSSLVAVAAGAARGHTIVVLQGGWNGHMIHYYANLRGATYTSQGRGASLNRESWMTLGGARLMAISRDIPEFRAMRSLPLADGDQLWSMSSQPGDADGLLPLLPARARLELVSADGRPVRQYVVHVTP
jgi:hypothetical protein